MSHLQFTIHKCNFMYYDGVCFFYFQTKLPLHKNTVTHLRSFRKHSQLSKSPWNAESFQRKFMTSYSLFNTFYNLLEFKNMLELGNARSMGAQLFGTEKIFLNLHIVTNWIESKDINSEIEVIGIIIRPLSIATCTCLWKTE